MHDFDIHFGSSILIQLRGKKILTWKKDFTVTMHTYSIFSHILNKVLKAPLYPDCSLLFYEGLCAVAWWEGFTSNSQYISASISELPLLSIDWVWTWQLLSGSDHMVISSKVWLSFNNNSIRGSYMTKLTLLLECYKFSQTWYSNNELFERTMSKWGKPGDMVQYEANSKIILIRTLAM